MDFCNTQHYLVGSVGPHLITFVTFSHLTRKKLCNGAVHILFFYSYKLGHSIPT
jgi:hypothetical protein